MAKRTVDWTATVARAARAAFGIAGPLQPYPADDRAWPGEWVVTRCEGVTFTTLGIEDEAEGQFYPWEDVLAVDLHHRPLTNDEAHIKLLRGEEVRIGKPDGIGSVFARARSIAVTAEALRRAAVSGAGRHFAEQRQMWVYADHICRLADAGILEAEEPDSWVVQQGYDGLADLDWETVKEIVADLPDVDRAEAAEAIAEALELQS